MRPMPAQAASADGTVGSLGDELGAGLGEESHPLRHRTRLRIAIANAEPEREVIDIETSDMAAWFQPTPAQRRDGPARRGS
jgi:hypothetical protein